jgi:hypothetical protein
LFDNQGNSKINQCFKNHSNSPHDKVKPKLGDPLQKQQRVECCREFLELCHDNEKEVIESIVSGDGTMILYYDPQSKRESIEWRRWSEPPPRKARNKKKKYGHNLLGFQGHWWILKTGTPPYNYGMYSYYTSLLHKLCDKYRAFK